MSAWKTQRKLTRTTYWTLHTILPEHGLFQAPTAESGNHSSSILLLYRQPHSLIPPSEPLYVQSSRTRITLRYWLLPTKHTLPQRLLRTSPPHHRGKNVNPPHPTLFIPNLSATSRKATTTGPRETKTCLPKRIPQTTVAKNFPNASTQSRGCYAPRREPLCCSYSGPLRSSPQDPGYAQE